MFLTLGDYAIFEKEREPNLPLFVSCIIYNEQGIVYGCKMLAENSVMPYNNNIEYYHESSLLSCFDGGLIRDKFDSILELGQTIDKDTIKKLFTQETE